MRGSVVFGAGLPLSLAFGWLAFPRILYRSEAQPLRFSHKTHTGDKGGMKCEDCHSVRADGSFTGIPALEKCAGCHTAPLGSTAEEKTLVSAYVEQNREIPWRVYSRQPDNAAFSHAQHVKLAKLACEECHRDHGSTDSLRPYVENRISGYSRDIWGASIARASSRRPGMNMRDCEHCHADKNVRTGCLDCHK
jgi:hypothetical protein